MIRLSILLFVLGFIAVSYFYSSWRLKAALKGNSKPLEDPVMNKLTRQMAAQLGLPDIKVNIYEIAPVNGLATPDGRIFITRGFMKKYRSGAVTATELASVIAHELGHVALGHSKRRLVDFAFANTLRLVVLAVVGRIHPVFALQFGNMLSRIMMARLSRQDEYEADAYAAALLSKIGIGVQPQIDLFKKLNYLTGKKNAQPLAWMMSHPKAEDRIAAIEKLDTRWKSLSQ